VTALAPPEQLRRADEGAAADLPRPVPWVAFAAAALPLIVAAAAIVVRRPVIYWAGDRALTELGVRAAAHGHQLLGIGGRFGWRHPGPLWLQLLVPLYELTAHAAWSLSVGAIAIHIAMIAIAVAVATRAAGPRAAAVLAAAVAVYLRATGLLYWTNLWAGYAMTWPLLALLVVAALGSSGARELWAFPAVALLGTLLVQTDVSTAVVVLATGVAAVALRVVRAARAARVSGSPRSGAQRVRVRTAAAVLAVLVVGAWVPPLVQQATHNPGNITLLVRFARSGAGGHPLRVATASVGAALSVLPLGARWVLHPGVEAHLGAGPWWAVAVVVAAVCASGAAAVVGWRRQRTFAADLAFLTAVGIVAAVVSMSRVDGPINFYLLMWATILPVTGVTAAVLVFLPETRSAGRDVAALVALAVAVIVGLVTTGLHGTEHDWDRQASRDVAAQTALVVRALGPSVHGRVLVHVVTSDTWPDGAGVAVQLQRRGARIEVDPGWVFLFGDEFAPGRAPANAEVWFARPHEAPALVGIPRIADAGRVDGVDVYTRRD